ncbi:MAG: ABC transporter transmembrane domain-containing protein, partial [Pseudomonadota bacterium]
PEVQPPDRLWAFYWHHIRQVREHLAVVLAVGFVASVIEVSMFAFLGNIVDYVRDAQNPAQFFEEHGTTLLLMAIVAMVIRPTVMAFHIMAIDQVLTANFTNLVRWQNHRYVLRQSLSFFQNDFAGRIANKVMQTGASLRESVMQISDAIWFVSVYTVGAFVLFLENDWRLTIPLVLWITGFIGIMTYFVPRIKDRAAIMSEARSMLTGRIVDSYTNIHTVKLFAHADREEVYAREAIEE